VLTAVVISAATKLSASPFASASELEVISNLSTKVASPCARVWAEWAGVRAAAVSDSARLRAGGHGPAAAAAHERHAGGRGPAAAAAARERHAGGHGQAAAAAACERHAGGHGPARTAAGAGALLNVKSASSTSTWVNEASTVPVSQSGAL